MLNSENYITASFKVYSLKCQSDPVDKSLTNTPVMCTMKITPQTLFIQTATQYTLFCRSLDSVLVT